MTYNRDGGKEQEITAMETAANQNDRREDARFEQALGDFRASVHAWSEAAFQPSQYVFASAPHPRVMRRSLAWAMGVILAAGAASGAMYERHHQQVLANQAHQRELERQREQAAAQRAGDVDDLLAKVDRDISQEVPDALEPLAQMMTEDNSQSSR